MNNRAEQELQKKSLLSGIATLGGAAIISKLLGTLQKIPLQNIAGDGVFGIYNAVYPFYILLLFLATAGFPTAISKLVAEELTENRWVEALQIVRTSMFILAISGMVITAVLLLSADMLARLIDNRHTAWAIRAIAAALLFVPLMSVLRGFFQGMQEMLPTAMSQVVEQLVRVSVMVGLLLWLSAQHYSEAILAAGATFGSVAGAIAGLIVMWCFWRRAKKNMPYIPPKFEWISWKWTKRLLAVALPICLGAIVVPILNIVDTFTLPRLFKQNEWTEAQAIELFGIYTRGLPLVQLVAMLFSSVSVVLVPYFAAAKIKQSQGIIGERAVLSLRLTWMFGLAASLGLAITAVPVNVMLFTDEQGSTTMSILAFTAVFSIVNIVSAAILQGLGSYKAPALHLLYAALLKLLLNLLLIPTYGMEGAAWAAVAAFAVAAALNIGVIARLLELRLSVLRWLLQPLPALLLMAVFAILWIDLNGWAAQRLSLEASRIFYTWLALSAVAGGAYVFIFFVFYFKIVTAQDLRAFPVLHHKLRPWLKRLGLWTKYNGRMDGD